MFEFCFTNMMLYTGAYVSIQNSVTIITLHLTPQSQAIVLHLGLALLWCTLSIHQMEVFSTDLYDRDKPLFAGPAALLIEANKLIAADKWL